MSYNIIKRYKKDTSSIYKGNYWERLRLLLLDYALAIV